MTTSASLPSIIVIGNADIPTVLLNGWKQYTHYSSFRAVKKAIRKATPALIIACLTNEDEQTLTKQVAEYIRNGLANQDTRIALIHEPSFHLDEVSWMEEFRTNICLSTDTKKQSFILATLNREIDNYIHIETNKRQHDAETDMLMCITQFSREKEPLQALLETFSNSLSTLCYSPCGFHIQIHKDNQGIINFCSNDNDELVKDLSISLGLPNIPDYLKTTLNEKKPQINLLPENINLNPIEEIIGTTIGSYLTFPISVYDKTLYLLMYFIPENQMDKVSMKQINVINKACEQLTMLLERRQAESSLKKQYTRLKSTLIDLKTTKEELKQQEKMANIGQMAAGIAHEINNPLSFVMSNFSSMDEYLTSIMQLQDLQSKFLDSIEIEQDNKIQELKNNISKFQQEEDIDFVLSDIRAVVSESHKGLKRVKNIITDLKSFTYSQSTELEECHLTEAINDTLKVLSYDLNDTITIDKRLSELPPFLAHNGLMQQVLTNLIKNAGQALIQADSANPKITISTLHKGTSVYIIIEDNGPGIPAEARNKIFEPFYTTKTVGEGTGLGLSVTFNIIKKLGGVIKMESEEQKFTRFIISFPIQEKVAQKII
jgi:signal transduction histidine kinase